MYRNQPDYAKQATLGKYPYNRSIPTRGFSSQELQAHVARDSSRLRRPLIEATMEDRQITRGPSTLFAVQVLTNARSRKPSGVIRILVPQVSAAVILFSYRNVAGIGNEESPDLC